MKRIESPNNICRHFLALELIKKLSFSEFLEIGIGDGAFLEKLAQKEYRGVGIDVSEQAISIASARLKRYSNIAIENKNFFEVTKKFDLVIMLQVLEHIENDSEALAKTKQLVKKGGNFLLSVPAHKEKWGYLDLVGGHYRRYEKEEIVKLLKDSGFEVLCFYSLGYPITNFFKVWEENFYKKYFFLNNFSQKTNEERTKISGCVEIPGVFGFPAVCKVFINEIALFPFLQLQRLFVKTELGLNYLILAKNKN